MAGGRRLAVVLVGNDPASEIYVRNKVKTCQELGIFSENITPPATMTTEAGQHPRGGELGQDKKRSNARRAGTARDALASSRYRPHHHTHGHLL